MIDPTKKYRTRDGREVRIYAVDGGGGDIVHGTINDDGEWKHLAWYGDGKQFRLLEDHPLDLIEVRPRLQREVWVNVYRHDDGEEFLEVAFHKDELDAVGDARIACVKLVIDCEEGEGL